MTQESDTAYKPGTIRKLKLVNFMCHESFELNFGPRVNFVIGPNGSGKSALLTALVVVLGGRATTTSRAKRADEFVMYGKKYATITCTIHNYEKIMEKDQAFKPDDYGKRIIVEKTIYDKDTARLVLKNDKGKRVSERSQELHDMLDHFGILINNPICVLNQEVSKSFLHSKKPEDKFELFMKATTLEQIERDYDDAKSCHNGWQECNNRKSVGFKVLDSEYNTCKEKVSFLINRAKLQDTHRDLAYELVWALIRDHETRAAQSQDKIDSIRKAIEGFESDSEQRNDNIEKCKLKIEQLEEKKKSCDELCTISKSKLDDNKRRETTIRMKMVDTQHKYEAEQRKIVRYNRDKSSLEKSIADLREKMAIDTSAEENERRRIEIECLESEIPTEKARENSIRQHNEQLTRSMNDTRAELHKVQSQIMELSGELSGKQMHLRRIKSGETSKLAKYGEHMVNICTEINKAYEQGLFDKKPLGPLGYYVRLKSPEVAKALELHLGRTAHAFTCDNIRDSQVLQKIIKAQRQFNSRWFEPLVLIRKHVSRHDANKFKAQHDRFKTFLDYIEVDEDPVYNILVDRSQLESVLFIPDYNDAENIMITPPLIPRHTRMAYTLDCYQMYPRINGGAYRCMANNPPNACLFSNENTSDIKNLERHIAKLEADIRQAQANQKRLEENYNVQRKEFDSNYAEIRKIQDGLRVKEQQLLNLKTTLTSAQPEELSAFETELENCLAKISECKKLVQQYKAEIEAIESDQSDLAKERDSLMKVSKERDQERQKVLDSINSEQNKIRVHQDTIRENEISIRSHKSKRDEESKNLEKHHDDLNAARRDVDESNKPSTIRETSHIQAELKKVERQLTTEIEENADPDELLASIKKRMKEIEQIGVLRDNNEQNFHLSSHALKNREDGFKTLRSTVTGNVATTFASVMRAMGMDGMLKIHLDDQIVDGQVVSKAKTLEMSIDTAPFQRGGLTQSDANSSNWVNDEVRNNRTSRSQPARLEGPRIKRARVDESPSEKENRVKMTDTRSLSGGERSFSTVAFVLALWHHCASPFKLMDEIDVFMDMVTRRISYNAMIRFAQITDNPGQFIFFSPLELPRIEDPENLVRVFEMPRIIRKGTQPSDSTAASVSFAASASS